MLLGVGAITAFGVQSRCLDGVVGLVAPVFLDTDTSYAPGYTERAFRAVSVGTVPAQVESLLGKPLTESWTYGSRYGTQDVPCAILWIRDGKVEELSRPASATSCVAQSIRKGQTALAVRSAVGPPAEMHWMYSSSPTGHSYRERVIEFDRDRVAKVFAQFYID